MTAAVYLARFRRKVLVIDAGESRLKSIALTKNVVGFPEGVSGQDLWERLHRHAQHFGGLIEAGVVRHLERTVGGFIAHTDTETYRATTVLLATGVVDADPAVPGLPNAMKNGVIRPCPICDGFEAIDAAVGVIGAGARALHECRFLRLYTRDVAVFTNGAAHNLTEDEAREVDALGLRVKRDRIKLGAVLPDGKKQLTLDTGETFACDMLYSALASIPNSQLLHGMDTTLDLDSCVVTAAHQETAIAGTACCRRCGAGLGSDQCGLRPRGHCRHTYPQLVTRTAIKKRPPHPGWPFVKGLRESS